MRSILIIMLALALSAATAFSAAQPLVTVSLSSYRISKNASGAESISSGESAKPGEILEYRATYHNSGTAPARNLLGTLPVPAEMEFVTGSAVPAGAQASTDGVTYSAIPLKRKVKLGNGTTAQRPVPASEYKSLRWHLKDLPPGASVTVTARMKIKDNNKGPVIINIDSLNKSENKAPGGKK